MAFGGFFDLSSTTGKVGEERAMNVPLVFVERYQSRYKIRFRAALIKECEKREQSGEKMRRNWLGDERNARGKRLHRGLGISSQASRTSEHRL